MTVEIHMTGRNKGVALIDDADAARASVCRWKATRTRSGLYATGNPYPDQPGRRVGLHEFLIGRLDGFVIDHINGDTLDNRRANLRHCLQRDNMKNQKKRAGTASAYKGVWWHKGTETWGASIEADGRRHYLGSFRDDRDAALAYDAAATRLHGEFARTNAALGLL